MGKTNSPRDELAVELLSYSIQAIAEPACLVRAGICVGVNGAAREALGLCEGIPIESVVEGAVMEAALASPAGSRYESQSGCRGNDGVSAETTISVVRFPDTDPPLLQFVFRLHDLPPEEERYRRIVEDNPERELDEQRSLLTAVLESLPVGITVADRSGRLLSLNSAARRIWGESAPLSGSVGEYSASKGIRVRDGKAVDAEEWPLARAIKYGEIVSSEMYEVERFGEGEHLVVELSASPVRSEDGEVTGGVACTLDVTALVRAEQAARRGEEELRTFANAMPQLCWVANPDGFITWYNQRWYEYTGTTPQQMEGWGWQSVHDPAVLPEVMRQWKSAIATGERFEMTFPLRGADGIFRPFLTRVIPLRDGIGAVVRWCGTNTDISPQKSIEDALRRANEDLESFAFAAAHDLQEPLRMVTSYTQLLMRSMRDDARPESKRFADVIVSGTIRMSALLGDLLIYTETGREAGAPAREVDLNETLREVRANLERVLDASQGTIEADSLPVVLGQEAHCVQLLQNLLSNALKYRGEEAPRVRISAERLEQFWLVRVRDNGIGIAPEYHERIFGVFKRLHGREIPGTGIGLAICKRVVERAGGQIWVESDGSPGQGSTFCFTLPAAHR